MRLLIVLLLLLYSYSVSAQVSYKKAIANARHFIDSLQKSQHIPGIAICVGNKDKILWAEGFGFADLENKVPVTTNSIFRVGSVSKLLTSLAVGRLYQQGKLDLDAPIQKYLPDFPEKNYPITARQLAAHTAGIRHYRQNDPISTPKRYKSVKESLSIFSKDTLLFKPGTGSSYSSYGFNLLSAVIEAAAQQDFLSYMRDSIFSPFGMKHTFPDYSDSIVLGRVRFYELTKSGQPINAALVDNSYKWAGGGFLSSPADLVTMVQGLLNHRLLDEKAVKLLFTPQLLESGKNTNVGIAWRINQDSSGVSFIHHGGLIDGGRTFVFFYPDSGLIFAIAANTSSAKLNIGEAVKILGYFAAKK